ncbi:hypothetical protein EDD86DRAFT_274479 [Gorgonomyces haynaldii]|nr:hypothetical protein EDD86DRAFT_274479 [Gorgonomyces haynaldii]
MLFVLGQVATQFHSSLQGILEDTSCKVKTVETMNDEIYPILDQVVKTSVYRYYKTDLNSDCPFWDVDLKCVMQHCSVEKQEYPQELAKVDRSVSQGFSFVKKCEYKETDFCLVEDEAASMGEWINLVRNPERFTGFSGEESWRVWRAIYGQSCLSRPLVQTCVENRLHSSISMHICNEYFDENTETWVKNIDCFLNRVGSHPDRLENLYFLWAVLTRAISKLGPYLVHHPFCAGTGDEHLIKTHVQQVLDQTMSCAPTFDESQFFSDPSLKLEIRDSFRNITRIMDCIECEKCRLWGKVQTTGLGTALKILFSYDLDTTDYRLSRQELVSLMNTYHRISESIKAVSTFSTLLKERELAGLKFHDQSSFILVLWLWFLVF